METNITSLSLKFNLSYPGSSAISKGGADFRAEMRITRKQADCKEIIISMLCKNFFYLGRSDI